MTGHSAADYSTIYRRGEKTRMAQLPYLLQAPCTELQAHLPHGQGLCHLCTVPRNRLQTIGQANYLKENINISAVVYCISIPKINYTVKFTAECKPEDVVSCFNIVSVCFKEGFFLFNTTRKYIIYLNGCHTRIQLIFLPSQYFYILKLRCISVPKP